MWSFLLGLVYALVAVFVAVIAFVVLVGIVRVVLDRRHNHHKDTIGTPEHVQAVVAMRAGSRLAETVELPTALTPAEQEARRAEQDARREWHNGCDAYIATVNARFDAIVAALDAPMEWPVMPTTEVLEQEALVHMTAAEGVQFITELNEQPLVFSWSTGAYPTVADPAPAPVAAGMHRRARQKANRVPA